MDNKTEISQSLKDFIYQNKAHIIEELKSWKTTFDDVEGEDDMEGDDKEDAGDYISKLIICIENEICNDKEFEDILFHIACMNEGEEEPRILINYL